MTASFQQIAVVVPFPAAVQTQTSKPVEHSETRSAQPRVRHPSLNSTMRCDLALISLDSGETTHRVVVCPLSVPRASRLQVTPNFPR